MVDAPLQVRVDVFFENGRDTKVADGKGGRGSGGQVGGVRWVDVRACGPTGRKGKDGEARRGEGRDVEKKRREMADGGGGGVELRVALPRVDV